MFAILRAALAFPHIHTLSSYRDFTDLHSPEGPSRCMPPKKKITTCQAEQAGAESQALPHWMTALQEKTSIPVKAETTKEIQMQPV